MDESHTDPVVDAEVHLDERPSDLAPYCDMPWQRALSEPGDHHVPWSNDSTFFPRLGARAKTATPARSPADLLERMGEHGIDVSIVLPGPLLKIGTVKTPDYVLALGKAYNRWLLETWLTGKPGIRGAILAVPDDPEAAAREIERYASHKRIVAVILPIASIEPLLGDRRYDPIYAAAEAADLPVVLHGTPGLMIPGSTHLVTPFASDFDQEPMGQTFMAIATLNRMVGTGVLVRYPNLRLLFLGAGITWLMHLTLRLDKEYIETRREVPWFTDRISHWLRRQVWVGTQPMEGSRDPAALADLIRISCGIDRVVYGSSWPEAAFDGPDDVADRLVDEAARRKVLGANALELFGIDAPSLSPARD